MSRVEKAIQKKSTRKKMKFISKILFILFMTIILIGCVFIIDKSAKTMLGEKTYNISPIIEEIQTTISEKTRYISSNTKKYYYNMINKR